MPVIDLGRVVGPTGPQGSVGPTGSQGAAGPSLISATTECTLNGVLSGNGAVVGVKGVDSAPTVGSNNLITSGVVAGYAATLSQLGAYVESTNVATRAYEPGDFIAVYGNLYIVTAAISLGGTISNGINCARTSVVPRLGVFKSVYSNSSSASSFAAQNISISNISKYNLLLLYFRLNSGGDVFDSVLIPVAPAHSAGIMRPYWDGASAPVIGYRKFEIDVPNSAVVCNAGYYRTYSGTTTIADNDYIVPVSIYGIQV